MAFEISETSRMQVPIASFAYQKQCPGSHRTRRENNLSLLQYFGGSGVDLGAGGMKKTPTTIATSQEPKHARHSKLVFV